MLLLRMERVKKKKWGGGGCAAVFHFISHSVYQNINIWKSWKHECECCQKFPHVSTITTPSATKSSETWHWTEPVLRSHKHFKQYVIKQAKTQAYNMHEHTHMHTGMHAHAQSMYACTRTRRHTLTLTRTPSTSYTDKTLQTVPLPTAGHMLSRYQKFHIRSAKTHTQRWLQISEGSHLAAAPPLEPWEKPTCPSGTASRARTVVMGAKLYPMAKIPLNIRRNATTHACTHITSC